MGCTETKGITVEELRKSPRGGSLQRRNSLVGSVTPSKPAKASPTKLKTKSSISLDKRAARLS